MESARSAIDEDSGTNNTIVFHGNLGVGLIEKEILFASLDFVVLLTIIQYVI